MPLPQGLTLNTATGEVTGTPLSAETANFTLRVRDAIGTTREIPSTIVVNNYTAMSFSGSLALATINVAYSSGLTLAGGVGPYLWSISVGTLPTGLTLNTATGVISGTPTVNQTENFTIRVQDALGNFITSAKTLFIALAPAISGTAPNGTLSVPYTHTYTTANGNPGYTYSLFSGSLPPGLTLSAGGVLSGTPTLAGNYTFVVRSTDQAGQTSNSASQTPSIAASVSVSAAYPRGEIGVAYSTGLTQTGGIAPFTYTVFSGAIPAGLTLNSATGLLSGTPTTAQTAVFVVRSVDSLGNTAYTSSQSVQIAAALTYTGTLNSTCVLNAPYSSQLTAANGFTPYSYTVSVGSLPTGLTLNASTGVVSGTPTVLATSNFTLRATDALGAFVDSAQSLTVSSALAFTSNYATNVSTGQSYNSTPGVTGGAPAYTFSVVSGAIPTGTTFNGSTGNVSGTPSAAGTFNFTVRVTDSAMSSVDQAASVVVAAAPAFANAAGTKGTLTVAYSYSPSITGGRTPLAYTISVGSLPAGLSLDGGTGAITGTPSGTGTTNFTLRVTDANGAFANQAVSLVVAAFPTLTGTLARGCVGSAYGQTLNGALGHTPYTFSVSAGAIPAGTVLAPASPNVQVNGTPTTATTYTPTIRLTDAAGNIVNSAQSIQIAAAVSISPSSLNTITQNVAFSQTLTATGGYATRVFSVSVGSPPTGISLSSAGVLSGTTSATGSYSFTVLVTDADGNTGSRSYSGTIAVALTAVLNDHSLSNVGEESFPSVSYTINSSGTVQGNDSGGTVVYSGEGVTVGSPSDVEYRATRLNGTASGTFDTWRNVASTPGSYSLSTSMAYKSSDVLIEMRNATTLALLDSCTISMEVEGI